MTKKPTEWSPLTMRSRWLLHQGDSTRCGFEGLSCFSFSADVDLEGEYGGSGPTIVLTSRISDQQCSMEFDSIFQCHKVPTW